MNSQGPLTPQRIMNSSTIPAGNMNMNPQLQHHKMLIQQQQQQHQQQQNKQM
jgi:hypothetical protein